MDPFVSCCDKECLHNYSQVLTAAGTTGNKASLKGRKMAMCENFKVMSVQQRQQLQEHFPMVSILQQYFDRQMLLYVCI